MNALKMTSIAAALLLGASSLALAQGAGGSGSGSSGSGSSQSGASQSGSQNDSQQSQTGSEKGNTGPTGPGATSGMTADTVRATLTGQGYSNVTGIKQSGSKYEAMAQKNGKQVKVFIDSQTGTISESGM